MHEHLPPLEYQEGGARAWIRTVRAHEGPHGETGIAMYIDDAIGVRTTKWENKLPKRQEMFSDLSHETFDRVPGLTPASREKIVFFRSPLCIGFSKKHLETTIQSIWTAGAGVYVQTENILLLSGDNLAHLSDKMLREKRAASMRSYRADDTSACPPARSTTRNS
ncbi:hypothetical protein AA14337_3402 [Acetobacter malorum DSM 14337]|uniref:Uncharacterized protein n=2 Tax=Acetobacter malorum TaxID=178901 RepID=A0ABQ0Q1C8_9PROT|nr:hypothetical protein AD930_08065 [Acetobacter malorum]GBQ86739.1 hypothetical protein AA14337_3402 [Acetobacter malorum DSM 14337]